MTWLDYAVIGILAASMIWAAWRGLVREVVSILGWVIAFLGANLFAGPLGSYMPAIIPTAELRVAAAFLAIFISSLVVTTLLGVLIWKIVRAVGLGGLDRMLGVLFGVLRGVLIVLAGTLLAGLTSAPREPYWSESLSAPILVSAALVLKPLLPQSFAERLRYD